MYKRSLLTKHHCVTREEEKTLPFGGILLYKLLEKTAALTKRCCCTRMLQEPHAGDSGSHRGKSWWHEEDPSQRRAWRICRGFSPGLLLKKHSHTCLNTASFQQRGKGFQTAQLCYCNHTAQAKLDRVALFSRIRFYKLHSSGAPLRCYAEVSGIVSITNKSLCSKFILDGNLASKA